MSNANSTETTRESRLRFFESANFEPSTNLNGLDQKPRSDARPISERLKALLDPNTRIISDVDALSTIVGAPLKQPYGFLHLPNEDSWLWTSSGDEVFKKYSVQEGRIVNLKSSFEHPFFIEIIGHQNQSEYYLMKEDGLYASYDGETVSRVAAVEEGAVYGIAHDREASRLILGDYVAQVAYTYDLQSGQFKTLTQPITKTTASMVSN